MAGNELARARWAIAAFFAVNGFIVGSLAPQLPQLMPRHAVSKSELGLLILGLGLGAVGAMLFGGRMIAALGSRRVTVLFAVLVACALPLVAMAPTVASVALAMALLGASLGSMDIAMNANAVDVERGLARAIMSSSHGFWSLGGFAGSSAGGLALAQFGAAVHGVAAMAVALGVIWVAKTWVIDFRHAPAPSVAGKARPALFPRDAGLWLLGGLALLCMVPEGAVLDWAAVYLGQDHGVGIAGGALAFALFSATMAATRFAGDAVRNRFGAVPVLRISALIGAVGLVAAALAPSPAVAIAGFAFSGIGVANLVPILFSAAGNQPGHAPGAGIATVTMVGYSGILLAPASIGFAADAFGFKATFLVLALLLGVVAASARRVAAADRLGAPG